MSIEWEGLDKLQADLNVVTKEVRRGAARALKQQGETIMTTSKRRFVPVDQGPLRASGFVDAVVIAGNRISVQLGFGGAASAYALIQHENMEFQHTRGGPKFLERPVNNAARRVAKAVGDAVKDAL